MKQRREGWATRKFNCVSLGGVEGCATRHPENPMRASRLCRRVRYPPSRKNISLHLEMSAKFVMLDVNTYTIQLVKRRKLKIKFEIGEVGNAVHP